MIGDGVGVGCPCGIDGNVGVGHGQRVGILRSCECAVVAGSVTVKQVACRYIGMAQCQIHCVAAAVVERGGLAYGTGDALGVGGDAADGIGSVLDGRAYGADGPDGDVIASGDGARCLALEGCTEGAGVVAVGDGGRCATVEGAAGIVARASHHLGLVAFNGGGGVEAVADGAVAPSNEAGAVAGGRLARVDGEQLAVEHAARNGARAGDYGHDAAVGAVALDAAVDGDAADAVADAGRALHDAYQSGGVLTVGADGAGSGATADGQRAVVARKCLADESGGIEVGGVVGALGATDGDRGVAAADVDVAALQGDESGRVAVVSCRDGGLDVEVADGDGCGLGAAALHVGEGCAVVVGGGGGEGQLVAATVEVAAEWVGAAARHAGDGILRRADVRI